MGIVIGTAGVSQPAFCDEATGHQAGRTDDLLDSEATEVIRVGGHVETDAVDGNLLADIAGDDAGVITVFL